MSDVSRGLTFGATESVTAAKLHQLVDDATVSAIVNADCDAAMGLVDTKLAQITTASKVHGTAITGLASVPSGAGVIPKANLTSVAQLGANSDITSLAGLTTALTSAQGGTGSTLLSWVVFDGTAANPITKAAGLNIDGTITKNGTGDYTITWDTNYGSANYVLVGTAQHVTHTTNVAIHSTGGLAAGTARIYVTNVVSDTTEVDSPIVCVLAIGNR